MLKIWFNNKIVNESDAKVSILSHALHYGTAAFEGIRFYNTKNGPAILRLPEHIKRLEYSASSLGVKNLPWTYENIYKAILKSVSVNKLKCGYIRPIIWYNKGSLGVNPADTKVHLAIIVLPWGKYLKNDLVSLKIVNIKRLNADAFDTRAKIAGHYVNSVTSNRIAKEAGYDEALLLDSDNFVAEGSGENIFMVKNGKLYTPSKRNILPGITRDSVIRIAKDLKIKCIEKNITVKELKSADEVFLTGTAVEITPVRKIDKTVFNKGKIGPVTQSITEEFALLIKGKSKRYNKWLTYIEV